MFRYSGRWTERCHIELTKTQRCEQILSKCSEIQLETKYEIECLHVYKVKILIDICIHVILMIEQHDDAGICIVD